MDNQAVTAEYLKDCAKVLKESTDPMVLPIPLSASTTVRVKPDGKVERVDHPLGPTSMSCVEALERCPSDLSHRPTPDNLAARPKPNDLAARPPYGPNVDLGSLDKLGGPHLTTETVWLIEQENPDNPGYGNGAFLGFVTQGKFSDRFLAWTTVDYAIRFARKQDAKDMGLALTRLVAGLGKYFMMTEHCWSKDGTNQVAEEMKA